MLGYARADLPASVEALKVTMDTTHVPRIQSGPKKLKMEEDITTTCAWYSCAALVADRYRRLLLILHDLHAQTTETFSWQISNRHVRVKLFLGILIIVSFPGDPDANTSRHIPHTVRPHVLVELHVDSNILCAHHLLGKSSNLLDSSGRFLLESAVITAREQKIDFIDNVLD